jgi:hypothetical protein
LNFQCQKSFSNQYLPHSESKSYQINSIKSSAHQDLSENTKGTFQFFQKFQLRFNLIFSEEIIQYSRNFCTSRPNTMKPSQCTPPRETFPKRPRM